MGPSLCARLAGVRQPTDRQTGSFGVDVVIACVELELVVAGRPRCRSCQVSEAETIGFARPRRTRDRRVVIRIARQRQ